jgi:hypothetical protein
VIDVARVVAVISLPSSNPRRHLSRLCPRNKSMPRQWKYMGENDAGSGMHSHFGSLRYTSSEILRDGDSYLVKQETSFSKDKIEFKRD